MVQRLQAIDETTKLLVLLTSGSAFALVVGGNDLRVPISGAVGVLASISAALRVPQVLEEWITVKGRLTRLRSDLTNLCDHLAVALDFTTAESKEELNRLTTLFGEIRASKKQHFILTIGVRREPVADRSEPRAQADDAGSR